MFTYRDALHLKITMLKRTENKHAGKESKSPETVSIFLSEQNDNERKKHKKQVRYDTAATLFESPRKGYK